MGKRLEKRALEVIEHLLESELSDYSQIKYLVNDYAAQRNDVYYVDVFINRPSDRGQWLSFKVEFQSSYSSSEKICESNFDTCCKIYIEMGEDHWEQIKTFDRSIRYFWITLLDF